MNLKGRLHPACTATDLVLTVTELLRKAKVVGKFVEFFGEGTASLAVPDRATLGGLRSQIDGPIRRLLPDGFTTKGEEAELRLRLAEGVEEGYAATYEQAFVPRTLQVHAVRFAVPPEPGFRPSDGAPTAPVRLAIGSTWILFHGDNGACSKAIEAYLRSLKT